MPRARQFDLIAFDWDGTLFDSTALITRCIQEAVRDVGAGKDRAPAEASALNAALLWVQDPTENRRRSAFDAALRRVAAPQGTKAMMSIGEPEPFCNCSGARTRVAPLAGSWSRLAMHSMAILCVFAISVLVA